MEYNNPSEIVKNLSFGKEGQSKIIKGIDKLADAVSSTLGASGRCVIYEDATGKPVITKDGVTVANSVVLLDPVENIGATLIKEAAQKTVKEAGDGTTTSTVLARAILKEYVASKKTNIRKIKEGINNAINKTIAYLDNIKIPVEGDMLTSVANISTNNDTELGKLIADVYKEVGKDGVVLMEESESNETQIELVKGVQFDSGLKSQHLITDTEKNKAELDDPAVLIVSSKIPNIRKIQNVLEYVIKNKQPLLIIADLEQQPLSALIMNKVKGNIKVNIVDTPGFGPTKQDTLEDLAVITGAKVISEELGDDLDLIDPQCLGKATKAVTTQNNTVVTVENVPQDVEERIKVVRKKLKNEKNGFFKTKLEQRLAMLSGAVGIIKVGANSKVELKEKKDRVEDAIHAVKAALQEGIVPGAGIALLNAAKKNKAECPGEEILFKAIKEPFNKILENAGIGAPENMHSMPEGHGINVITGIVSDMVKEGIVDPVLVTKTALINAASVATTIISADCIISNVRLNESSK